MTHNLTITEQTQTKNNPLFKLTYDTQLDHYRTDTNQKQSPVQTNL